jgi:hypothetical protein
MVHDSVAVMPLLPMSAIREELDLQQHGMESETVGGEMFIWGNTIDPVKARVQRLILAHPKKGKLKKSVFGYFGCLNRSDTQDFKNHGPKCTSHKNFD